MQGLQKLVILAWALAWNATGAWAQFVLPEPDSGQRPYSITAERSGERAGGAVSIELATQLRSIHVPGARFVKLHFSAFNLPEGVIVEVSNPAGSEVYRYSASHRDPFTFDRIRGDTGKGSFWAMSISGETAIVRMLGDLTKFDPAIHSAVVDSHIANTPGKTKDPVDPGSTTQTECGQNERYDAICWADSHPGEYDRSVPVAMIVTSAGKECTAWRVGSGNRMFTARHCIASQAELDGAEIWFNFETTECGGPSTGTEVKVTGGSLLKQDYHLDYALFTVDDFASISSFGSLGLDVRNGVIGEEIFIPQHGLGRPKQLAIESDMNDNGLCQVDANDIDGFEPESDIGYLCDTTTSSSGSPVISSSTGKVIALHHWGGCFNSGTKVTMIWPQVAEFFGGSVPKGNEKGGWAPGNELPVAQFSYSCDELDCTLNGGESYDEDGEIINFTWDFGDGVSASGAIVEHSFSGPGNYPVILSVKDDEDATYSQLKTVTTSLPNENPVAKFSTSCIDNACSFDAGGSKDEDGTVVAWDWSLGDGESATGQSIEQVYSESGSYTISLTVTDDDDATGDSNYTVTVNLPNEKPIAKFSSSCTENSCSFDAADSLDEDGTIVDWSWSLGDGASKSGIRFEHAYAAAGSYSITLTIEDDRGARDSVTNTVAVTMENQPPQPRPEPVANFSASCEERLCSLDAGSSTQNGAEITTYEWSFGDGTYGSGQAVSHAYQKNASYTVTLKIIDSAKSSSSKTQLVKVVGTEEFTLSGSGTLSNGRGMASLIWTGTEASSVSILRNGKHLAGADNSGKWIDSTLDGFTKTARYQLCESDSDLCSNEIIIHFTR